MSTCNQDKSFKNSNDYYFYCFTVIPLLNSPSMRYSRQRETILQTVKVMDLHPSADDVYSRVRKRMPQISLGTIYRNLNQLEGMGELSCVQDGKMVRYDCETGRHQHFRCDVCGILQNVDVSNREIIDLLTKNSGLKIIDISLELTGTCEDCICKSQ